jgi:hypothetical protein
MSHETADLTARQSLDIITTMIREAKGKVQRNNFYFILWGWVIVLANIGMYALTQINYERPYVVWLITIPAWIYTLVSAFKRGRAAETVSHLDRISGWLWMSFGVTIFIFVAFGSKINFQINPVILTITAIPTLVSGIILRFKPFIFGGIVFWIAGIATFLSPMIYQPLIGAAAIIAGYLVPGYMLKKESN